MLFLSKSVLCNTLDNITWVIVAFNNFITKKSDFEARMLNINTVSKDIPKDFISITQLSKANTKSDFWNEIAKLNLNSNQNKDIRNINKSKDLMGALSNN